MDRLVFNTPSRFGDASESSARFLAFILLFLGFLGFFSILFILWYIAAPVSRDRVLGDLQARIAGGNDPVEIRENAFLFADPETAP